MSGWVTNSSGLIVCEEADSRHEAMTATAFEVDVVLRCAYSDRFKVIRDIYINNVSYPDVPNCLCASFAIKPFNSKPLPELSSQLGFIQYHEALLSVKYSTAEYTSSQLYIETLEPLVQGMVMPSDHFSWDPTPSSDSTVGTREAPSRHIHTWAYTVQWIQQKEIPPAYFNLPGCVHNADYTIARWGKICPVETVLYTAGPSGKSVWIDQANSNSIPQPGWDYTCKFLINEFGWNNFYRAALDVSDEPDHWVKMYQKHLGQQGTPFNPYPRATLTPVLLP